MGNNTMQLDNQSYTGSLTVNFSKKFWNQHFVVIRPKRLIMHVGESYLFSDWMTKETLVIAKLVNKRTKFRRQLVDAETLMHNDVNVTLFNLLDASRGVPLQDDKFDVLIFQNMYNPKPFEICTTY